MSIFIVRHGETAWNAARIVQLPDVPLSERGIVQAERLAERLAAAGVAHVMSSDFVRARMTAERIAARAGTVSELEPLLRERDFGEVRGMPYTALGVDIFAPDYSPPGGETWRTFQTRVARAWERIQATAAEISGNLVVVTHGLVCRTLVEHHLAPGKDVAPIGRWLNTSLTEVDPGPPLTIHRLNCVAHLDPDPDADTAPV